MAIERRLTRSFLSLRVSARMSRTPVAASSSAMYVACLTKRPMTDARRIRSVGTLAFFSILTKRIVRLLFIRTFAVVVSMQSVSKYASTLSLSCKFRRRNGREGAGVSAAAAGPASAPSLVRKGGAEGGGRGGESLWAQLLAFMGAAPTTAR